MDLKGSLVNTALRIYPSEKCLTFLETLSDQDGAPNNILKLLKINKPDKEKNHVSKESSINFELTNEDIQNLNEIKDLMVKDESQNKNENDNNNIIESTACYSEKELENSNSESQKDDEKTKIIATDKHRDKDYLTTQDIEWLYAYLKKKRSKGAKVPYLHELLEKSDIATPENQVLKRNPDLEARCVKLRAQQEAREYRAMTKGVDNVRLKFPEDSISYQLKQMNRQLIAIGQFILSIFAGFLFGFRGVEWMVGNIEFGFRLLLGVMCALVIALAEIYFLAKKISEELSVPETVQIGGPPKFVDDKKYGPGKSTAVTSNGKEHQD